MAQGRLGKSGNCGKMAELFLKKVQKFRNIELFDRFSMI